MLSWEKKITYNTPTPKKKGGCGREDGPGQGVDVFAPTRFVWLSFTLWGGGFPCFLEGGGCVYKKGCVILPSLYPSSPPPRSARHKCARTPFALRGSKGLIEGKAVGGGSDVRGITMMSTNSPESSFVTSRVCCDVILAAGCLLPRTDHRRRLSRSGAEGS